MISIHRAHIHWDTLTTQVQVHELATLEDRQARKTMTFSDGASKGSWKEQSTKELVSEMCTLALDLIVTKGFDAHQVFREFLKVEEFRRAGACNFNLARVFSFVKDGEASDNLDRWAEE
jgi:hypothetical protein